MALPSAIRFPSLPQSERQLFGWLVVIAQVILVVTTFPRAFSEPRSFVFNDIGDGLKNVYTLGWYANQPTGSPLLQTDGMNYPYGESILYTDATVAFALPYRFLSDLIPAIKPWAVPVFHWLILAGLVWGAWLAYRLLTRLGVGVIAAAVLGIALVWINPQAPRVFHGLLNLSVSWVVLLAFHLLLDWKEGSGASLYGGSAHGGPGRSRGRTAWGIALLVFFASFIHFYYLPLLAMLIGAFAIFSAIAERKAWHLVLGLLPFAAGVLVFSLVRWMDPLYAERSVTAGGYGFHLWKLQLDALYTPYDYFHLQWIVRSAKVTHHESSAFLGHFALYGLTIAALFGIVRGLARRMGRSVLIRIGSAADSVDRKLILLFLATLPLLFVALGERVDLFGGDLKLTNYLNPFFYLHLLSDRVTQFRCLGRFVWPFFWAVNLLAVVLVGKQCARIRPPWATALWIGLLTLALIDARDMMHYSHREQKASPLSKSATDEWSALLEGIDLEGYQAILPLPYWHVGSEDYDLTLDPKDLWSTDGLQLARRARLPLMAVKMSRTSLDQTRAMLSIFGIEGAEDPGLMEALGDRPVLVFHTNDVSLYYDPPREPAHTIFERSLTWPHDRGLEKLAEEGSYSLWRWVPGG